MIPVSLAQATWPAGLNLTHMFVWALCGALAAVLLLVGIVGLWRQGRKK